MRRKDETLQATILNLAREIAASQGPDAISIRAIAKKADIATGTIYNYYSGKQEILLALTEEYWHTTLLEMQSVITSEAFCDQLEEIYRFLKNRISQSAGMLMQSLAGASMEAAGRTQMQAMQQILRCSLLRRMEADPRIRDDIWSPPSYTPKLYADFILASMVTSLTRREDEIQFLIELVKRTLY